MKVTETTSKAKGTVYTVDVELRLKEKPTTKSFTLMGVKGRVLKSTRCQDYWTVIVKFRADSMLELMAVTDDHQVISRELH